MANQLRSGVNTGTRTAYLDNLRVSLVILVVLHHIAAVYGAGSPFYYVEPPFTDSRAFQALLVFMLANQGFFMGILFFLAGFFTPGSLDRKGPSVFLKDKLLRLGIPLVLFIFVLNPVSSIGYYLMPAFLSGISTPLTWKAYPDLIGIGPLWFVAMLLLFSFGYVVWRKATQNRKANPTKIFSKITYAGLGVFAVALAAVSYLLRIVVPLGKSILDFPTLSYLPQYLSFFVFGAIAYRRKWLETISVGMGMTALTTAIIAGIVLFPLAFSGSFFSLTVTSELSRAMGNGHWRSAIYALWDSLFSVGLCVGLVVLFRRFMSGSKAGGRFLSRHSYTVYIIHIPIIVFLAYALRNIDLSNLAKFGVATVVIIPACFVVAYVIKKIPGTSKIL